MSNKVKYGLKNAHYAVITESDGNISYGTPVPFPGAVSLVLNPVGENTPFYADDMEYFSATTNNGYDGSLEMANVDDDFRVDVLGDERDSNGAIVENKDNKVNRIALMYEFDGDAKKTRHVNYYVKVARPNVESSTKTTTIEPSTDSMALEARPSPVTGDVKAKVEADKAAYDTFYSAVYLKDSPTNTVDTAEETFSLGSPSDLTIATTSTDATNEVKNVKLDGANIGGAYLTVDGADVTVDAAYLGDLDIGDYIVTVEFLRGNAVTVELAVTA